MRNFVTATFLLGTSLLGLPTAKADDCFWDGYQLGQEEAKTFCSMWERMYTDDAVVYPSRPPSMRLCEQQLVTACKQGMAQEARDNYPLCTWLVRNSWVNRDGQDARTAWAQWQRGACNVVLP